MHETSLLIDISLDKFTREVDMRGDVSALSRQFAKMMIENEEVKSFVAMTLVQYHILEGNFSGREGKVRLEIAQDDPDELLEGCV